MIVSVHQPQYLPWLGYFDKIDQADVFCFLDDVQYKKNEWQNRNRIKTAKGWQWLTVPVQFRFPQKINEVKIDYGGNWPRKHLQAISTNYVKAKYFNFYIDFFQKVYHKTWENIDDLNIYVIKGLCDILGMGQIRTIRSSEMDLRQDPTDRLIDICLHVGADAYLAGASGAGYMDLNRFEEAGIAVVFQSFTHPKYPQVYGEFESNLSIVDLLMNCGPDSMSIIREAQKYYKEIM